MSAGRQLSGTIAFQQPTSDRHACWTPLPRRISVPRWWLCIMFDMQSHSTGCGSRFGPRRQAWIASRFASLRVRMSQAEKLAQTRPSPLADPVTANCECIENIGAKSGGSHPTSFVSMVLLSRASLCNYFQGRRQSADFSGNDRLMTSPHVQVHCLTSAMSAGHVRAIVSSLR